MSFSFTFPAGLVCLGLTTAAVAAPSYESGLSARAKQHNSEKSARNSVTSVFEGARSLVRETEHQRRDLLNRTNVMVSNNKNRESLAKQKALQDEKRLNDWFAKTGGAR